MSSGRYSKTRFKERINTMSIEQLKLLRDELKTTRKNIARIETRISKLKLLEAEG